MNVPNITNGVFYIVCILPQFKKKVTGSNNTLVVGTRKLLKVTHYLLLGLKGLENQPYRKNSGLQDKQGFL